MSIEIAVHCFVTGRRYGLSRVLAVGFFFPDFAFGVLTIVCDISAEFFGFGLTAVSCIPLGMHRSVETTTQKIAAPSVSAGLVPRLIIFRHAGNPAKQHLTRRSRSGLLWDAFLRNARRVVSACIFYRATHPYGMQSENFAEM